MTNAVEFYESEEWQAERRRILRMRGNKCQRCGVKAESPHVHHKYGLKYRKYEILCPDCHAKHHGRPEIAECRRKIFACRDCGAPVKWGLKRGKWKPCDPKTGVKHKCKP